MEPEEITQAAVTTPPTAEKQKPERKYYVSWIPYNVTTFEELDAMHEAQEAASQVQELTWQFFAIMENILYEPVENKAQLIQALATELARRMDEVMAGNLEYEKGLEPSLATYFANTIPALLKHKSFGVLKGTDGKFYAYGKPTNNFKDRDEEILEEVAHVEFLTWLDANPDFAPELWLWHEESAKATTNRACWWDWADNSLHAVWELTEEEAKGLLTLAKEYDLAMSHGFYVMKRFGGFIKQYRMFEASVLPREFAANIYTDFTVMEEKMFTSEKRAFLVKRFGEAAVVQMEAENQKQASSLQEAGVQYKEESAFDAKAAIGELKESLPGLIANAVKEALGAVKEEAPADSTSEEQPTEPVDPVADAKQQDAPAPRMSSIADILNSDPITGEKVKALRANDALAKAKPDETAEQPDLAAKGLAAFAKLLQNPDQFRQTPEEV